MFTGNSDRHVNAPMDSGLLLKPRGLRLRDLLLVRPENYTRQYIL